MRLVVEQPQAAVTQDGGHCHDVGHPVGQLLDAGTALGEERGERRPVAQRREQLDGHRRVPDGEHRLAYALVFVGLLVDHLESERRAIEREGGVHVGHGDADVVDAEEELFAHRPSLRASTTGLSTEAMVSPSVWSRERL
jgi:hypothetical protein